MSQYLPMLVMRTHCVPCAVELNGMFIGEVAPERTLSLPLSDTGEYYIGVTPLCSRGERYYSVMRKISFVEGRLQMPPQSDLDVYAWPGGVYEIVLEPGMLEQPKPQVFPYTISQLALPDAHLATLYYDNGLCFAIEEGRSMLYGTRIDSAAVGTLRRTQNGLLAVQADLDGGKSMLLIVNSSGRELLRVQGETVQFEQNRAVCIERLDTAQGHERRTVYRLQNAGFAQTESEVGFFTHECEPPADEFLLMRALCEAVREGFEEEALSYLTPSLREGLTFDALREFFGSFAHCRRPLIDDPGLIGLCCEAQSRVHDVRLFSFSTKQGLIDDIAEG